MLQPHWAKVLNLPFCLSMNLFTSTNWLDWLGWAVMIVVPEMEKHIGKKIRQNCELLRFRRKKSSNGNILTSIRFCADVDEAPLPVSSDTGSELIKRSFFVFFERNFKAT